MTYIFISLTLFLDDLIVTDIDGISLNVVINFQVLKNVFFFKAIFIIKLLFYLLNFN